MSRFDLFGIRTQSRQSIYLDYSFAETRIAIEMIVRDNQRRHMQALH